MGTEPIGKTTTLGYLRKLAKAIKSSFDSLETRMDDLEQETAKAKEAAETALAVLEEIQQKVDQIAAQVL